MNIYWHQLRKINKSKFINTMYIWIFIVPITTRIFEKVGDIANVTIFQYNFELQLTLPFSWAIFYFCAIAFAIANIIYQILCPDIIKDNSDYSDFKLANKGVEHLDRYMQQIKLDWEILENLLEERDDYFLHIAGASNPKQPDGILRKRFIEIYNKGDEFREISRKFSFAFYMIGFLLLSIVFIQNIIYIVQYLSKQNI